MRENVRENMRDYEKTEILNTPELSCAVISIIAVRPVGHASRIGFSCFSVGFLSLFAWLRNDLGYLGLEQDVVMIAQQQLLEWAWHPERSSFPSVFELQG